MSTVASHKGAGTRPMKPGVIGAVLGVILAVVVTVSFVVLRPSPHQILVVFPSKDLMFASHIGLVLQNTDIMAQNGIEARFESADDRDEFDRLATRADVVLTDQTHALRLSARPGGAHIVANLGSAGRVGLVVPVGSPVESIQALRGASIASPTGNATHRFLLEQTTSAGLAAGDWELRASPRLDQSASLGTDAVMLWDPTLYAAEFQGSVQTLARGEHFATVTFDDRLVGPHREQGLAVLTAIKQAMHHFNSDPRQSAIWLAGDTGKPAPQMQRACFRANGNFGWHRFVSLSMSPELPSLRTALEADNLYLVSQGYLGTPADLDRVIDGSLMDSVDIDAEPLASVGTAIPTP